MHSGPRLIDQQHHFVDAQLPCPLQHVLNARPAFRMVGMEAFLAKNELCERRKPVKAPALEIKKGGIEGGIPMDSSGFHM